MADPQNDGGFGSDPAMWNNLMNFGAGTLTAAGDRTAGGFLRYPGMTALGAGVQNMQQMNLQRMNVQSEAELRQAEAMQARANAGFLTGQLSGMQGLPQSLDRIFSGLQGGGTPTAPMPSSGAPSPQQSYTGTPTGAKRDSLLIPPEKQDGLVDAVTAGTVVPPWVVHGAARTESHFDAYATGKMTPKGEQAQGWMQVMPSTAAQFGITNPDQLRDPYIGGKTGVAVLDASARKHGITGPNDPKWGDPATFSAVMTDYYGHGTPMSGQPSQAEYIERVRRAGSAWWQDHAAQAQAQGTPNDQLQQQVAQNTTQTATDTGPSTPQTPNGPIDVGNARPTDEHLQQLHAQATQAGINAPPPPPPQVADQIVPNIGITRRQAYERGMAMVLANASVKAHTFGRLDLGLDSTGVAMINHAMQGVELKQGGLFIPPFAGESVKRNPDIRENVIPGTHQQGLAAVYPPLPGEEARATQIPLGGPGGAPLVAKLSPEEQHGAEEAQQANRQQNESDQVELTKAQDEAEAIQRNQTISAHVYDLAEKVKTGAGTTAITTFKNYLNSLGPDFVKRVTERITGEGLDPTNPMLLAKYSQLVAAQQAETYTHARTGIAALVKFEGVNPGLEMPQGVNLKVPVANMIAMQSGRDWLRGAQPHFNKNSQAWRANPSTAPYNQLSNYSDKFNETYSADMYYRAMEAATGKDYDGWSAGLGPDQQKVVLGIIKRARPQAPVFMGNGRQYRASSFDNVADPRDLVQ